MPFLPTQLSSEGFFCKASLTYKDGNSIRNNYFLIYRITLFLFIKERVEPPYFAHFCSSYNPSKHKNGRTAVDLYLS